MNYTTNYQLPVWAETDRILMEDFNDMTEALESALDGKGNCRLFTGSYVGTGTLEQSFAFPAKPWFVAIIGSGAYILMTYGITQTTALGNSQQAYVAVSWTGYTATWHTNNYALYACNGTGGEYRVIALIDAAE